MWESEEERWSEHLPYGALAQESCREYAYNAGAEQPDLAWINTPLDTWEPNPHYRGPTVPHPEEFTGEDWDYVERRIASQPEKPAYPALDDDIPW